MSKFLYTFPSNLYAFWFYPFPPPKWPFLKLWVQFSFLLSSSQLKLCWHLHSWVLGFYFYYIIPASGVEYAFKILKCLRGGWRVHKSWDHGESACHNVVFGLPLPHTEYINVRSCTLHAYTHCIQGYYYLFSQQMKNRAVKHCELDA